MCVCVCLSVTTPPIIEKLRSIGVAMHAYGVSAYITATTNHLRLIIFRLLLFECHGSDKDPKQLPIHRKHRTATPVPRPFRTKHRHCVVGICTAQCDSGASAKSAFLLQYPCSYVAITGLQTCMLASRLV